VVVLGLVGQIGKVAEAEVLVQEDNKVVLEEKVVMEEFIVFLVHLLVTLAAVADVEFILLV
jgi:hypothetical protein